MFENFGLKAYKEHSMLWEKRGRIFVADGQMDWMMSHAIVPTPILLSEGILRIYITFCDEKKVGRVGYVDVDANNPGHVLRWSKQPCLDIGLPGQFDDNGVLCCSIARLSDGRFRMYYVGFELCHHVRYRLLTGIAESEDGECFLRLKNTPVLERTDKESLFRGGPFYNFINNQHELWYVAGDGWVEVNGIEKPTYVIKKIQSENGVDWPGDGKTCFEID